MQIILLEKVLNVGNLGDVVTSCGGGIAEGHQLGPARAVREPRVELQREAETRREQHEANQNGYRDNRDRRCEPAEPSACCRPYARQDRQDGREGNRHHRKVNKQGVRGQSGDRVHRTSVTVSR